MNDTQDETPNEHVPVSLIAGTSAGVNNGNEGNPYTASENAGNVSFVAPGSNNLNGNTQPLDLLAEDGNHSEIHQNLNETESTEIVETQGDMSSEPVLAISSIVSENNGQLHTMLETRLETILTNINIFFVAGTSNNSIDNEQPVTISTCASDGLTEGGINQNLNRTEDTEMSGEQVTTSNAIFSGILSIVDNGNNNRTSTVSETTLTHGNVSLVTTASDNEMMKQGATSTIKPEPNILIEVSSSNKDDLNDVLTDVPVARKVDDDDASSDDDDVILIGESIDICKPFKTNTEKLVKHENDDVSGNLPYIDKVFLLSKLNSFKFYIFRFISFNLAGGRTCI